MPINRIHTPQHCPGSGIRLVRWRGSCHWCRINELIINNAGPMPFRGDRSGIGSWGRRRRAGGSQQPQCRQLPLPPRATGWPCLRLQRGRAMALLAYLPGVANEAASEVRRSTNGPLFDLGALSPLPTFSVVSHLLPFNIARPMSRRPRSSTASPPSNYKPALVPPTTSAVTGRSLSKK